MKYAKIAPRKLLAPVISGSRNERSAPPPPPPLPPFPMPAMSESIQLRIAAGICRCA